MDCLVFRKKGRKLNQLIEQAVKLTRLSFRNKKCKVIFAISSVSFAISYMIFTGIFIFMERPIPDEFTVPMFRVSTIHTVYGDFPWLIAFLDRHTVFSMSMEAMMSTVVISFLVGINSSLLTFRFMSKNRISCSASGSVGLLGIVPAFMSIFACCGGGVLVVLFGAGILASLFPYGSIFSLVSIAILSTGILLSTRNLGKVLEDSISKSSFQEDGKDSTKSAKDGSNYETAHA